MSFTDTESRQCALDPEHSFIVQAPAGSGKTELLTQRFLKLLTTVNEPEEIIAITFTKKAAAEMRHRILTALNNAAKMIAPSESHKKITFDLASFALQQDKKNNWQLLKNPNRLRIWTIDSFNGFLSARIPILAGFGSKPTIEDSPEFLYEQASRELIRSLATQNQWQEHLKVLMEHLDNKIARVITLLKKILAKREQWLPHIFAYHSNNDFLHEKIIESLINIANENITAVMTYLDESSLEKLGNLAHTAAKNIAETEAKHALFVFLEDASLFAHKDHLHKWKALTTLLLTQEHQWRKKIDKRDGFPAKSAEKICLSEILESFSDQEELREALIHLRLTPECRYPDAQKSMIEALIYLLPILCAELHLIFQKHHAIDFTEINLAALRSLGNDEEPTDLALYLDYQIKHLLIDEFQDTSITQFTLLERLIRGWEPNDGHSLFLVGDPMQSIYRFRDAEVGLFLRAQLQGINSLPLQSLTLTHNYRSDKSIISWINDTFHTLLPKKANMIQGAVPYTPSIATQDYQSSGVHFHGLQSADKNQEASHMISLIRHIHTQKPHETIAILVRARTHLVHITQALQDAKIAYTAVELQKLINCPIIQDLITLTRALLHREDRIAWYGLLRSPICGLLLNDLHILAGNNGTKTIWSTLQDAHIINKLSLDAQKRINRILPALAAYFAEEGRKPFELALKGLWYILGFSQCIEAQALRDANRYFQLLSALIAKKNTVVLPDLIDALNKTYSEPTQTAAQLFVMTIHKAKGLEFDHVLLPGLNHKSPKDDNELMLWLEKPNWAGSIDFVVAPIKHAHDDEEIIYDYLKYMEQKKLAHESVRLLYVAVTRAKKSLQLLANLPKNDKNETLYHSGSFAKMLETHFNQHIQNPTAPTETLSISSNVPLLTRFSSHWQLPHTLPISHHTTPDNPLPPIEDPFKRLVGTVIHERIASPNIDLTCRLKQLGIPKKELSKALDMIHIAMLNMEHDPRAQWILNPNHDCARSEYPITAIIDGKIRHLIIDRTFVENDIRWIIDYKTSIPEYHDSKAHFLEREKEVYKIQLETYAKAFASLDKHPIKVGLYFPMFSGWIEWKVFQTN